jgi:uncharacterized lipoprotein YajG
MSKQLASLMFVFLCSACALVNEHVDVAYTPDPAIPRVLAANPGGVMLDVTDRRRAESPDWIADKKNGYGMRLANVLAQKPVTDLVRDALAQELTARGFQVGTTGATASVEVSRLESIYQLRILSVGAIGYADLSVQVRRPDGSIAYARTFSAENDEEASLGGTAGQARRSVERILTRVIGQVVSDPAFVTALSSLPRLS